MRWSSLACFESDVQKLTHICAQGGVLARGTAVTRNNVHGKTGISNVHGTGLGTK